MTDRSLSAEIPYIAWEIQLTCNMGCEFCYSSSWNRYRRDSVRDQASMADIERGLARLAASGLGIKYINWSGGEPLLRRAELPAVLEASSRSGFGNILSTNGMFSVFPDVGDPHDRATSNRRFRAYVEKQLAPWLEWLAVSWDSADPMVDNDVMRLAADGRRGSRFHCDDVLAIIEIYRSLEPRFRLKINTLVSRQNYRSGVLEIGDHLADLDVTWKLIQFNPRECPKDFRSKYWLETEEFLRLVEEARQRFEGRPGFERLRIARRVYDGAGEPYCFLVVNTSGEVLLPKGEQHVPLARLYGQGVEGLSATAWRDALLQKLETEIAGTRTCTEDQSPGHLTPLQLFARRNLEILEHSYGMDPFEFEPFR